MCHRPMVKVQGHSKSKFYKTKSINCIDFNITTTNVIIYTYVKCCTYHMYVHVYMCVCPLYYVKHIY